MFLLVFFTMGDSEGGGEVAGEEETDVFCGVFIALGESGREGEVAGEEVAGEEVTDVVRDDLLLMLEDSGSVVEEVVAPKAALVDLVVL
jgi:hypothetical protein